MSRMDLTTQELFLQLGTTSMSRSAKADALFRRLRDNEQDDVAEQLVRAPSRLKLKKGNPLNSEQTPASLKKAF